MRTTKLLLAAALCAVAATAEAQAPLHSGLHLHVDVGVGGSRSRASLSGDTYEVSGAGVPLAFGVGGAVAPGLILGGGLWVSTVYEPELKVNGSGGTASDTSYDVVGFGPLLTVYVPGNFYLSAMPSLTRMTLSRDGDTGRTDMGLGLRAAVGKEWQVGDNWGLGLALVGHLSSNKDSDGSTTWKTAGAGLVFSASYH